MFYSPKLCSVPTMVVPCNVIYAKTAPKIFDPVHSLNVRF